MEPSPKPPLAVSPIPKQSPSPSGKRASASPRRIAFGEVSSLHLLASSVQQSFHPLLSDNPHRPSSFTQRTAAASPNKRGGTGAESGVAPVGELHEELTSVDMIFSTLSSSLSFYQFGAHPPPSAAAAASSPGAGHEVATPQDAADFLSYFTAVITSAVAHASLARTSGKPFDTDSRRGSSSTPSSASPDTVLTRLVFDNSHDVVGVLTQLVRVCGGKVHLPKHSSRLPYPHAISSAKHDGLSSPPLPSRTTAVAATASARILLLAEESFEDVNKLRLAAIHTLKLLLTQSLEVQRLPVSPMSAPVPQAQSLSVMRLLVASFLRCGTLSVLMNTVGQPTASEDIRAAAVETLFLFLMEASSTATLTSANHKAFLGSFYDPLLRAATLDSNARVRSFSAAILRHFAGCFPTAAVVVRSVPTLLRVLLQEESLDAKALHAGALECVVNAAGASFDHSLIAIYDITDAALKCLVHACATLAVARGSVLSAPPRERDASASIDGGWPGQPTQRSDDENSQTAVSELDYLVSLVDLLRAAVNFSLLTVGSDVDAVFRAVALANVPQILARLLHVRHTYPRHPLSEKVATLLALLVVRPPPYLGLPLQLADATPASNIVAAVVASSSHNRHHREAALGDQFLLDVAIAVAGSLLFSPSCRVQWARVLLELPTWKEPFTNALSKALTDAPLDTFSHLVLLDEFGATVNDVHNVEWDDSAHPNPQSVQCLLDAQEIRKRLKPGSVAESLALWRGVEDDRRRPDPKRGFLCFVMMGYSLLTLGSPYPQPNSKTTVRDVGGSARGRGEHESTLVAESVRAAAAAAAAAAGQQSVAAAQRKAERPFAVKPRRLEDKSATVAAAAAPPLAGADGDPMDSLRLVLRTEFDAALTLVIHLSKHYHRKRLTQDELALKSTKRPLLHLGPSTKNLRNPYEKPRVNVDKALQLRTWTAAAVEEGDVFYFSIPLATLNVNVVEAVVAKARRHTIQAKKNFLTTPQSNKERRWFLLDMHTTVMPTLVALLLNLKKMLSVHNEEHVRMILNILPSLRTYRHGSVLADDGGSAAAVKAISCANLLDVNDYITQAFSMRMASERMGPGDGMGSFAGDPAVMNSSMMGGGGGGRRQSTAQSLPDVASFFAPVFPPSLPAAGDPQQHADPAAAADAGLVTANQSGTAVGTKRRLFDVSSESSSDLDDDDDDPESEWIRDRPLETRSMPFGVRAAVNEESSDESDLELVPR